MANQMKYSSQIFAGILLISVATLTGCNHEYLSRDEGVTNFAGEALAANEAISVVDTWPDGFDNTDIPTNGKRQAAAVKRYRNPEVGPTASSNGAKTQSVAN